MSYSAFFQLGLSLASEPKDTYSDIDVDYLYPQITLNVQAPTPPRPVTRRRRSSLTILTSPMSGVKSTIRTASDAVRVVLRSPVKTEFDGAVQGSENVRPGADSNNNNTKKLRRKTVSSAPPVLRLVQSRDVPLPRFPPPTSPLPPTPLSPSFKSWSHSHPNTQLTVSTTTTTPLVLSDMADPVLPQTPTQPNHDVNTSRDQR